MRRNPAHDLAKLEEEFSKPKLKVECFCDFCFKILIAKGMMYQSNSNSLKKNEILVKSHGGGAAESLRSFGVHTRMRFWGR
jgi:hypothetical protein